METTDFTTQDGRGSLQNLRRLIARAVSQSRGNTEKVTWLALVLLKASDSATADTDGESTVFATDSKSDGTRPELIAALRKALSESSKYAGDYKTQLIQDLADADTILTA